MRRFPLLVLVALASLPAAGCKKEPAVTAACATCVVADEKGFTPSRIDLPKGKPGEVKAVTFTRTSDDTCARDVVFADLGVKVPLPLNTPVSINVPVDQARSLSFTCGMKMYKSSVVVN